MIKRTQRGWIAPLAVVTFGAAALAGVGVWLTYRVATTTGIVVAQFLQAGLPASVAQ